MTSLTVPPSVIRAQPAAAPRRSWASRHWFLLFALLFGLWVWLPFLAPVLMHLGSPAPARAIYFIYSFFCHQLPERSFFLFGPRLMVPLPAIEAAGGDAGNLLLLRRFIGAPGMGWKVAWSDRMISFYTSLWTWALLWHAWRRAARALPWWACVLLLIPMVLDGGSHMVSDLAGVGNGFRDSNAWLAALTAHALPAGFYAGDAIGSFNSFMRLITGILAGIGLAWFAFPHMEASFAETRA